MTNDDIDPVGEIRAIREGIMRKHKTLDAYFAHLRTLPSPEEMHARIKTKLADASDKPVKRPATPRRRRTAKA